jgi:DNA replication ATP-dependent helicase Dna2
MLSTTYRLNEDLCRAISSAFYAESTGERLHPSESARNRAFPSDVSEKAEEQSIRQALSAETSSVWLQVNTRNCRQFNQEEAVAAARLVATCIKSGMSYKDVAVVTPFRRQVMHIRRLIAAEVGEGLELPIVDTVERVQGLTVEVVILSFCASDADYVASIADFLFSPNRLNVGVSRARTKAIVIASPNVFNTLPNNFNGFVSRNICHNFLNTMACIRQHS